MTDQAKTTAATPPSAAQRCPPFPGCWTVVLALVLLLLFAPVLSGNHILVFRDAAYWHMNTLQWTAAQWQAGSVPLWNDWQGLGVNWVGQGTTTVFYPGTWLLTIPAGQFGQRYAMVIVLHLLLCGAGTFRLARDLGAEPIAAWLAALTFALSGPMLALHGNWPFLIGATWLPWATSGLWQAIVQRQATGQWIAAAAVSLMILGGEPQAVGLWLLTASGLVVLHVIQRTSRSASLRVRSRRVVRLWQSSRTLLTIGLLAAGGSCIQWWPLWETSQTSTRAIRSAPANIYQAATLWQSGAADWAAQTTAGLLGPPEPQSQADQALQFSQPPWHWTTLVVGNAMGTWRTVHARWDRHLAANDRVWNPTLYAGAITAVLVFSHAMGLWSVMVRYARLGRRGRRRWRLVNDLRAEADPELARETGENRALANAWLWLLLVAFGLGSCGWYGAVWLWVEIQAACGGSVATPSVGPQVGGVYWWLTLLCPGFDQFRYPAKLWIIAALAWSLLGSVELSHWLSAARHKPVLLGWTKVSRRALLCVTTLMLVLLLALGATSSPWFVAHFFRTFQAVPLDPWLGALHVPRALLEMHLSLIQSLVVCGLLCGGLFAQRRRLPVWWGWGLVAITVADVTINNAWLVQTIDARVLTDTTIWETKDSPYRDLPAAEQSLGQQRFWYEPQLLHEHRWQQMSEKWGDYWPWQPTDKLTWQAIFSMRATGAPQFHLAHGVPSANVEQTLDPIGPTVLRDEVARTVRSLPKESGQVLWRSYLRSLGVRYWLGWANPAGTTSSPRPLKWTTLTETPPPVWLADQWEIRPPVPNTASTAQHSTDMREAWFKDEAISDSPTRIVLDQSIPFISPASADIATNSASGIVRWQFTTHEKIAVVKAEQPVVVVWRQWHDPGWWAVVQSGDGPPEWQPTFVVQRIFTGLVLPPGEHQIRLIYFPSWFWLGGLVTLLTWCGLLGVCVYARTCKTRPPTGTKIHRNGKVQ
ncbi:MAG: hypothetical protein Q8M16_16330 [Pirellulaceae bacterium]|nr:hypothetical protein [Pirellulaceae bacterium]